MPRAKKCHEPNGGKHAGGGLLYLAAYGVFGVVVGPDERTRRLGGISGSGLCRRSNETRGPPVSCAGASPSNGVPPEQAQSRVTMQIEVRCKRGSRL